MRFALTADQVAFQAQLGVLLADRCRPADVRAAWSSPRGWSDERWAALADLGVTGLTVPAAAGGLGLGPVDLVALLEELGRAAAPEPVAETVGLAVPVLERLAASGHGEAGAALEAIASGTMVATVAVSPGAVGAVSPGAVGAVSPGAVGTGALYLAPAGADLVVVCTGDGVALVRSASGPVGSGLPGRAPVGREPAASRGSGASGSGASGSGASGSGASGRVESFAALDGCWRPGRLVWDPASTVVPLEPDVAGALLRDTVDRGALCTAAVLVGLADRMLGMAVDYAGERRQFGQPVGSFQAVKHLLADVAVRLEHTRPAVLRAAWSLAHGEPTAGRDVSMAKAMASELALGAARASLQVHGAIGYTWEHDLQLWMKRAWCLAVAWGDATWHQARLLAEVAAAVDQRPDLRAGGHPQPAP